MFGNIGGKIKTLAKVNCCLGITFSIILGIVFLALGSETESSVLTFIGLIVAFGGAFFAWVSSFLLFGFGELVYKTSRISDLLEGKIDKKDNMFFEDNTVTKSSTEGSKLFSDKNNVFGAAEEKHKLCKDCGAELSHTTKRCICGCTVFYET